MNRATLIGHVGKDPEIRTMQNGNRVANFSIATTEKWTDKQSGERKEQTEWHKIVVFNDNLVSIIERFVKKGSKILVEGAIKTKKWTDQGGQERYTTEIVLQAFNGQIVLLSSRDDNNNSQSSGAPQEQSNAYSGRSMSDQKPPATASADPFLDDEIPF